MAEISFHNILHLQHAKETTAARVVGYLREDTVRVACAVGWKTGIHTPPAGEWLWLSLTAWVKPWLAHQTGTQSHNTHQAQTAHSHKQETTQQVHRSVLLTFPWCSLHQSECHRAASLVGWLSDLAPNNNQQFSNFKHYLGWDIYDTLHAGGIWERSYIHIAEYT